MKKPVIFILFFLFCWVSSFAQDINIAAGVNYGGPIPVETVDSSSGRPLVGISGGISYSMQLNDKFTFIPALYYSYRALEYGQDFTRDTLFTVEIGGTTGQVPSFYTAYARGKMRLHYVEVPLLFGYKIKKFQLMLGPYFAFMVAGKDDGKVRVVIGEGGFFDDVTESFDNTHAVRKFEPGVMFGSRAPIMKDLSLEMMVSRSFTTLYDLDKLDSNGGKIVKMYSTYMRIGLLYTF